MIEQDLSQVSDGYHTFEELYDHRNTLFCAFLLLADRIGGYDGWWAQPGWRSKRHSDGTVYDGWFIAGIELPSVGPISYHLPMKYWDSLNGAAKTLDCAPEWDGYTPADVLERLQKFLSQESL